jgi:sugar lactone lactonase YvrE
MAPIRHGFTTGGATLLPMDRARVFFDGVFTQPRLQHAEGVAIGPDGWIWCGSENGQIMRIAPDGSHIEEVAVIGGLTLGLAFDGDRALFACEQQSASVFRLDLADHSLRRFTPPGIRIPNYPVVDARRNRLLVSDSVGAGQAGPGVWAYHLETGVGGVWDERPREFANGMTLSATGDGLFVCETFLRRIIRIAIEPDGRPGAATIFADDLPGLPDGIAFDDRGRLFVGCYEPSRLLRISADGKTAEVYIEDPTAHLFAHPTNIAFDGSILYTANLGRWHITRVETDTSGRRLVETVGEQRS